MEQDIIVKCKKRYHNQMFHVSWLWVSNNANNPYISIICGEEEDQISFHKWQRPRDELYNLIGHYKKHNIKFLQNIMHAWNHTLGK